MKSLVSILLLLPFLLQAQHKHVESQHKQIGFVENKGQWDQSVLFKSEFEGGNLWVQQHKFLFHFQDFSAIHEAHLTKGNNVQEANYFQDVIHLNFVNSNTVTQIEKSKPSIHYFNYFIGNKKEKWASDVHSYETSTLKNFYNNIDLKIINQNGALKYEFHVAKQIDPAIILLDYVGQKNIKITKDGNLEIESKLGKIVEEKPYAYQEIDGEKVEVSCEFELINNSIKFKLGSYQQEFPLVIDPDLIFATYNGAQTDNFGMTATYGYDGTAYSAGIIFGNQMPIPDSSTYDINSNFTVPYAGFGRTDVFLSKYSSDGSQMLWSTFLGGGNNTSGTETAHSLICDKDNNVYVYGVTSSSDFPTTTNAFRSVFLGGIPYNISGNGVDLDAGSDIFVSKISSNGHQLLGSSYFGGTQNDGVNTGPLAYNYGDQFRGEIMLDSLNNVLIASCTYSGDFPITNAIQNSIGGNLDGILFKFSNDFSNLIFSTFIGGSSDDALYSVKIDSSYNIVFAGGSNSTDINSSFFQSDAFQNTAQGNTDGIIGKLSPDGFSTIRMTYLGYSNYDQIYFVEINSDDEVFVLGQTLGGQFQVVNASYSVPNSSQFIAKLDPFLTDVTNATVFGNGDNLNVNISPCAFLVDLCGNIYVSGWGSNILNMNVTPDNQQASASGSNDFYLMVLQKDFNNLLYATYLGGPGTNDHVDGGTSRYDRNGIVYQSVCAGCGGQSDFPVTQNAWSSTNNSSNCNNLVYKFDFKLVGKSNFSVSDTTGCAPFSVTFQNNSSSGHLFNWDFGDGTSSNTEVNPNRIYNTPGQYNIFLAIQDTVCDILDTMKTTVIVSPQIQLSLPNDSILCQPSMISINPIILGSANQFIWSSSSSINDTLNSNLSNPNYQTLLNGNYHFFFQASNQGCQEIDSISFDVVSSYLSLQDDISLCNNDTKIIQVNNVGSFPFNYSWSPLNLIENQLNDSTIQVTNQNSGYLYLTVTSTNNCSFNDSILIQINPNSVLLSVPNDTILCKASSLVLSANSFGTSNQFIWSTSSNFSDTLNAPITSPSIIYNGQNSISYYIKTFNADCERIDTLRVTILESEIDLISPGQICQNEAFNVSLINSSGLNLTYVWSPESLIQEQVSPTSIIANTSNPGYIYVDVLSPNGCTFRDSVYANVSVLSQSAIDAFASDTIVLVGSEVTLTAIPNGNYNYQWTPQQNLSTPTSYQTTAIVNQTTTYYVQINEGNCSIGDTVIVYCFTNDCKPPQIYVPNAFSPNGKGRNDILYVRGPNIDEMLFRIYNRWGQLVFESRDQMIGWDGSFEGKKLDPDVFDYYLSVKCIGGVEEIIKGNVTILK
jgi:gliding motility-associated-like protein